MKLPRLSWRPKGSNAAGSAASVMPREGRLAIFVGFLAAVLAFFAVLVLALALAAGRLAESWSSELAQNATLQVFAPSGEVEAQARAALNVLRTTPGVASMRVIEIEEQRALLAPWLGTEVAVDDLPMPLLIEVVADPEELDRESLEQRLAAEAPGAVFEDHAAWRQPLVATAEWLRIFGFVCLALLCVALAAVLALAARAAVAASARAIATLRLVGARDGFIAAAFTRRLALATVVGAALGSLAGLGLLAVLPSASEEGFFLVGIGPRGWEWALPFAVPLVAAAIAYATTSLTVRRNLRLWS